MQSILRHGRRGVSLAAVLYFAAFVLVPLMLLTLGIGRYLHARSTLSAAADAAALAAARDVDMAYYRLTGELRFAGYAWDEAYGYAMLNSEWLIRQRVYPQVTHIHLHHDRHVVEVIVGANAEDLFGGIGPVWIEASAEAEVGVLQEVYP
jgi:hypothetical protein